MRFNFTVCELDKLYHGYCLHRTSCCQWYKKNQALCWVLFGSSTSFATTIDPILTDLVLTTLFQCCGTCP